jgi:hypothetical protein
LSGSKTGTTLWRDMQMSETINRRILDKIKNSKIDEPVKKFLREVLIVELKNFEIGKLRYTDEYEYIRKHCMASKVSNHED